MEALKTRPELAPEAALSDTAVLERAFLQFNEASKRLEAKYELLVRETESLREQLREKDLAVKRAERLATLGETAAAIAHEVRNPLGAIKLFASLLKREVSGKANATELVDQIEKGVTHLDGVVGNILSFSRTQAPALAPVNVHSIIQERVSGFSSGESAGKLDIQLDLKATPFFLGNELGLRQIIYNLTLNAAQAMRHRGTVRIATADDETGALCVKVSDTGPGIPAEVLPRIFEPFVTTRNEGTGLGLAIVQQIVEQHGGTISAANRGGAEFTILFPRQGKRS